MSNENFFGEYVIGMKCYKACPSNLPKVGCGCAFTSKKLHIPKPLSIDFSNPRHPYAQNVPRYSWTEILRAIEIVARCGKNAFPNATIGNLHFECLKTNHVKSHAHKWWRQRKLYQWWMLPINAHGFNYFRCAEI